MSAPLAELKTLMLLAPRLKLAVAESITCGCVQSRIGAISGASEFFLGGITAYTLDQKVRHLGVDRALAAACNCVSAEVAGQMARGAAALFGADIALATTGYAESVKLGAIEHEPFAYWALTQRNPDNQWNTRMGKVVGLGLAREPAQRLIADTALAELLAHLRSTRAVSA